MRVSVAMTVYNATWCVERALDSVLAQSVRPAEIFVCDDGSTDGTPDLVEQRYGGAVNVLRLPHKNASATRRVGFERATGDWFAFMDADDTWLPDKMEKQIEFLAQHPEVKLLSSDGVLVSAEGVERESWLADYFDPVNEIVGDLYPLLVERCFTLMSAMLVDRKAYEEAGGLDPAMVYSHDLDLWMRICSKHPGAIMKDKLITYYTSPNALSRRFEGRYLDNLELMRRVERNAHGRPELCERGAERAASLEYDLALMCLRTGRTDEARARFRRAAARGRTSRRLLARMAANAPDWAFRAVRGSSWLKGTVQASREPAAVIPVEGEYRGAA